MGTEGGGAWDTAVQKPDLVIQPAGGNALLAFLPPPRNPAQASEPPTPALDHPPTHLLL